MVGSLVIQHCYALNVHTTMWCRWTSSNSMKNIGLEHWTGAGCRDCVNNSIFLVGPLPLAGPLSAPPAHTTLTRIITTYTLTTSNANSSIYIHYGGIDKTRCWRLQQVLQLHSSLRLHSRNVLYCATGVCVCVCVCVWDGGGGGGGSACVRVSVCE